MQTLLVTGLFFLGAGLLLLMLFRRAACGRIAPLPGEVMVCEERDIAVDEKRVRHYRYGRCLVRLTDRRLLIAQKIPLFKDAYHTRFVLDLNSASPGIDIGMMVLHGYVPARISPAQVALAPDGAATTVTIDLLHSNGKSYGTLSFRSERATEYARRFIEK